MSVAPFDVVALVLGVYAAIGALVGAALLAGPIARIDPAAAAAPLRVKLLWMPGLVALWPVALLRLSGVAAPEDRG